MGRCLSIKGLLVASNLRWLALAGVVVACLGLVVVVARSRREDPALPEAGGAPLAIRGFHTFMHDGDRLQLSVSADSLTVSNAKLLGPFRLGFVHFLAARNVTVETFHSIEMPQETLDGLGARGNITVETFRNIETRLQAELVKHLLSSISRILAPLVRERGSAAIVSVECRPLKLIQREGAQATVVLEAAVCRTRQGGTKMICKDGVLRVDGDDVPFRELTYDGRSRALHTTR